MLFVILAFLDYPIFWKKTVLLAAVLDFLGSIPAFALTMISSGRMWLVFLADGVIFLITGAAVYLVLEREAKKAAIASCLGYACYYQIYVGSFYIQSIVTGVFSVVICTLLCYGMGRLLRKLRISDCVDYLIKDKRKGNGLLALGLVMSQGWYVYHLFSGWLSGLGELFPYQTWLLAALFLAVLLYITFYARHKQREEAREAILMQQRLYIENLEELEREIRMYRHDYKNMLSGLMLSASQGDVETIREFLKNSAGGFEESIGKRIQQTTQLANLRQTELKSLVLTKLIRMQELGIPCHFEAAWPVEKVNMNPMDLNRCVGILLDNAMEEAARHKEGSVGLIFICQNNSLTVLVENTVGKDMELSDLFKEGYSTKGAKRGVGLASYARIVDKYKNAMSMTGIREGRLVQELKIGG